MLPFTLIEQLKLKMTWKKKKTIIHAHDIKAFSFIHINQNLEATKCPSVGEWKNNWDSYIMEYYPVI